MSLLVFVSVSVSVGVVVTTISVTFTVYIHIVRIHTQYVRQTTRLSHVCDAMAGVQISVEVDTLSPRLYGIYRRIHSML